jgi:hypothetical protein
MNNLFDFLKNYRDTKSPQTYGDILEGRTMVDELSQKEAYIYEQFKHNDRMRLINSGRLQ